MPYCREASIVKHDREKLLARALKCHSWNCEHCLPERRSRLIREAHGGRPNTFLTLTTRREPGKSFADATRDLSRAWRLLRLRALRESQRDIEARALPFGAPWPAQPAEDGRRRQERKVRLSRRGLPFLAVVEKHKSGWPHLHILAHSEWIDFEWLQLNWRDLTGAHHVRVERIGGKSRSASYVAKYCGKVREPIEGGKRYWKSRDYEQDKRWREPPQRPAHLWIEQEPVTVRTLVHRWLSHGYDVEPVDEHTAWARPPPGGLFGPLARAGGKIVPAGSISEA